MAGRMMPEAFSFENNTANTKIYQFQLTISQTDGSEAAIFYNTSGYTRGFFFLNMTSVHGSLGWAQVQGQISRYGLDYTINSENMAYQSLGYVQKQGVSGSNGIKLSRVGTYGTTPTSIHGYFYSPAGAAFELYQSISGSNTVSANYILSRGV